MGVNRDRCRCRSFLQGLFIVMLTFVLGAGPALAQAPATKERPVATKHVDAKPNAARARTGESAAEPSGGPQEGIKVHGHWVIEVRNPDNTLVARREFNNHLDPIQGTSALMNVLSRRGSVGLWTINLGISTSGQQSPCGGGGCVISEGTGAVLFSSDVLIGTDLTVVPNSALHTLNLKGSGAVPANGAIGMVLTGFALCPGTVAPQTPCQYNGPTNGFFFTQALAPADFALANVSAGQIVQISVTFTFS